MTKDVRSPEGKIVREAQLRWVPIDKMRVSAVAQREKLNQARVDKIAAEFDPEELGYPTVNERDGYYYIIDGWHRVEAIKQIGWGDQKIECWRYAGLTEEEEAEKFLKLNDTLPVSVFDKFRVGVQAGRIMETDIDRIVRAHELVITREEVPGAIRAVGTLGQIYNRFGPGILSRTLQIVRDAYGDSGLVAPVLYGVGLVVHRYGKDVDHEALIKRLSNVHAGVSGLLNRAETLRLKTGTYKSHCVAAAIVEIYNRSRGGKKLQPWFKGEE